MLHAFLLIIISLAHAIYAGIISEQSYSMNGYKRSDLGHLVKRDFIDLVVDGGWYDFQFRDTNSTVRDIFRFRTLGATTLRITDNYCAGDVFEVWDNDEKLGTTNMVYTNECLTNTTNPDRAYGNDNFSHGEFNLEAGAHKIKIRVLKSPFTAGSGAIRVDSLFMGCVRKLNGFTIISTPVPFFAAAKACRSFGLRLADINIENFMDATNLAFQCSGAFSQTWVKSYWGNTYGGSCLAVSTGNAAPGGSINVPQSCEVTLPVLCQEGPEILNHQDQQKVHQEHQAPPQHVQHPKEPYHHPHNRHHHAHKSDDEFFLTGSDLKSSNSTYMDSSTTMSSSSEKSSSKSSSEQDSSTNLDSSMNKFINDFAPKAAVKELQAKPKEEIKVTIDKPEGPVERILPIRKEDAKELKKEPKEKTAEDANKDQKKTAVEPNLPDAAKAKIEEKAVRAATADKREQQTNKPQAEPKVIVPAALVGKREQTARKQSVDKRQPTIGRKITKVE